MQLYLGDLFFHLVDFCYDVPVGMMDDCTPAAIDVYLCMQQHAMAEANCTLEGSYMVLTYLVDLEAWNCIFDLAFAFARGGNISPSGIFHLVGWFGCSCRRYQLPYIRNCSIEYYLMAICVDPL
jgi:hypothetical protein